MSKDDSEEKTLPPSQKKLRDARKKGQVAKSHDIVMAVTLTSFFLLAYLFMGSFLKSFANALLSLEKVEGHSFEASSFEAVSSFAINLGRYFFVMTAILIAGSVITNVAVQKGFLFSLDAIRPNPDNLNPVNGFKQIFSLRSLVELIKNVLRAAAFFVIAFYVVTFGLKSIFQIPLCGAACEISVFTNIMGIMVAFASILLLLTGILDINLQSWLFRRKLRMSKSELKRELKDQEGSPEIRGSRRRTWRSQVMERQTYSVEDATLIIAGNTLVVGLRYVPGETPVPVLVCKGRGESAGGIFAAAHAAQIPVVTDEDLAAGLFQTSEIGTYAGEQYFDAIARALVRTA